MSPRLVSRHTNKHTQNGKWRRIITHSTSLFTPSLLPRSRLIYIFLPLTYIFPHALPILLFIPYSLIIQLSSLQPPLQPMPIPHSPPVASSPINTWSPNSRTSPPLSTGPLPTPVATLTSLRVGVVLRLQYSLTECQVCRPGVQWGTPATCPAALPVGEERKVN